MYIKVSVSVFCIPVFPRLVPSCLACRSSGRSCKHAGRAAGDTNKKSIFAH